MKKLENFVEKFNIKIRFKKELIVKRNGKYFLLDEKLKNFISSIKKDFIYAGTYLGKVENEKFVPSVNLLRIISKKKGSNKIFVNEKSGWLFICGRDVFKKGIIDVDGSLRKGEYALVLNRYGECLGFGEITYNLKNIREHVVVKNVFDIGDFLRRERPLT
ncbi:hypothetical protein J7L49_05260 [Candidatus Bathyarchaeota archaeon]|nr:hypothetical protein [Candidatus Bathyarchaeota archaeon]